MAIGFHGTRDEEWPMANSQNGGRERRWPMAIDVNEHLGADFPPFGAFRRLRSRFARRSPPSGDSGQDFPPFVGSWWRTPGFPAVRRLLGGAG
jgi:hypothetical protein